MNINIFVERERIFGIICNGCMQAVRDLSLQVKLKIKGYKISDKAAIVNDRDELWAEGPAFDLEGSALEAPRWNVCLKNSSKSVICESASHDSSLLLALASLYAKIGHKHFFLFAHSIRADIFVVPEAKC